MSWLSDSTIRHLREIGDLPELGERYEIIEAIGQGGMGKVFRAHDRELERDVALKVLNVARFGGDAVRRMVREARILAGLEHPGIVPIHDVGALKDGRVYYTMKLVKGSSLDEHARTHPEPTALLRVFERMCEAVAFAHAHGVIHRDLKPENVMVGAFGEVLVMDWGVAKILGEPEAGEGAETDIDDAADEAVTAAPPERSDAGGLLSTSAPTAAIPASGAKTHPGTILGTPGYMAPEQAAGHIDAIDRRTDVYALGVILDYLLGITGEKIPRSLQSLIGRATERDPADRYESVEVLAAEVANYLSGSQVAAHREAPWERIGRILYRFRTPIILVLVYVIVRLLIFIFART